ncbi:hypothetical protein NX059_012520 [Plenodomus lindquistii]|nr:hypothetical protein NX059_012520 [Plenodomus lindquistii]
MAQIACTNSLPESLALREQITSRNQQFSPFLRLPAELRNKIYVYAVYDQIVSLSTSPGPHHLVHNLQGLLVACRQIREECLLLFYAYCIFQIDDNILRAHLTAAQYERIRYIRIGDRSAQLWRMLVGSDEETDLSQLDTILPALERVDLDDTVVPNHQRRRAEVKLGIRRVLERDAVVVRFTK